MIADVVEAAHEGVNDPNRAAVGDDQHPLVAVAGEQLVDEGADARGERREVLGVGRAGALAAPPASVVGRESLLDLCRGQPLPSAEPALAKALIELDRDADAFADDLGGLARAGEVARVDPIRRLEGLREGTRLLAADLVERHVRVALPALVAIPVGLAVADQEQGRHLCTLAAVDLGLAGRVCLVTGSTGGIGFATARLLAAEGARVVVTGRDAARVERAKREAGAEAGVVADPAEPDVPERLVRAAEELGPLDCLVNNVGVAYQADFLDVPDEQWDELWQLNVMSYIRTIRAAVPAMRERGSGVIVNVSSTAGKRPSTSMPHYSVTKAAVLSLSRLVADLYAKDGIRCNAVTPGPTATASWLADGGLADQQASRTGKSRDDVLAAVGAGRPLGRLAEAEEIAAVVAFLCSERASYVTGAAWSADGGTVPIII